MFPYILFVSVIVGTLGLPAPTAPSVDSLVQRMFQGGDANKDGIYTKPEAWARLLSMDKDGKMYIEESDGKISLDEYIARWNSEAANMGTVAAGIFRNLDSDQSGFIEQDDVSRAYGVIDVDSNGQVTSSEFGAYFKPLISSPSTTPIPEAFINMSFTQTDLNKDGFISFDEEWADIKRYDINGDDKVGKIEFMLAIANTSFGSSGMDEMWPDMFDAVDFDGNRFLEKPEVQKFYQLMDVDHNNAVSREEVLAASKNFNQLLNSRNVTSSDQIDYGFADADTNHDGFLTMAEDWAFLLSQDRNGNSMVDKAEYLKMIDLYPDDVLRAAERIFDKYDKNSDGFFGKEDVATFFNEMDTNGDGKVSRNVYVTFVEVTFAKEGADVRAAEQSIGRVTVTIDFGFRRLDTNQDSLLSIDEQWSSALKLDTNGDQRLSLEEYLFRYANLSIQERAIGQQIFNRLDYNRNGFWDKSDLKRFFNLTDTSGDGFVSLGEYVKMASNLYLSFGVNFNNLATSDSIYNGFLYADANNDGKLTPQEEWASALTIDLNGDKKISKDEYVKAFATARDDFKAAAPKIFDRFDPDHNGFIEQSDVLLAVAFLDTNGDGYLSPGEYMDYFSKLYSSVGIVEGPIESFNDYGFDAIDTNKDGLVSVDEEWTGALSIDSNGDRRISEYEYIVSFADSPVSYREAAPGLFRKFDVDGNGFIERSDVVKSFKLMDTIGDGFVSKIQYSTFVKEVYASFNLTGSPVATKSPGDMSDFGFHRMDTDHNGHLTFDEEWADLILYDTDGDGRINVKELTAVLPPNLRTIAPQMLNKLDSDNNGFWERMDIRRFFTSADSNGDGTLSSPEFSSSFGTFLASLGVDPSNLKPVQMGCPSLCSNVLIVLASLVISLLHSVRD